MFVLPSSMPQTKSRAKIEKKEDGAADAEANRARLREQMQALEDILAMLRAADESDDEAEIAAAVESANAALQ